LTSKLLGCLCHLLSALFTLLFLVSLPPFVIFCLPALLSCCCILILLRLTITPEHHLVIMVSSRAVIWG
jgi:hypothetical protein